MATIGLGLWAGFTTRAEAAETAEEKKFRRVVHRHLERYPFMELQDLYKLTFQAAMGSEHAVSSRQAARQWLEREVASLEAAPNETLCEPLSPDGNLVRVNLRAFVETGGDLDELLDAFVDTATRFQGSEGRLERYWSFIEELAREREIPFNLVQVQRLWTEMVARGLPVVHHSSTYKDRYQPAYRVVLLELLSSDAPTTSGQ